MTRSPGPTDINMFALTGLVRQHGGHLTFPNRLEAVDRPHIKRCITFGLVEVVDRNRLRLTSVGAEIVLRRLQKRLTELLARCYDDDRGQRERALTMKAHDTLTMECAEDTPETDDMAARICGVTIERCSICNEPAHASETDDHGNHARCALPGDL